MHTSNTLVIPDLYGRTADIDQLITTQKPAHTVLLGGYFGDDVEQNLKAAQWLRASLRDFSRTHLLGVRDLQYAYPYKFLRDRYDAASAKAINSVLNPMDWALMRFHCWSRSFLLTHAGLQPVYLPTVILRAPQRGLREYMAVCEDEAWTCLLKGKRHWFYDPRSSKARPGGGIVSNSGHINPVPGLHQIHGFNYVPEPMQFTSQEGVTFCINGWNQHSLPPFLSMISKDGMTVLRTLAPAPASL